MITRTRKIRKLKGKDEHGTDEFYVITLSDSETVIYELLEEILEAIKK